jgi:hypothetical protein
MSSNRPTRANRPIRDSAAAGPRRHRAGAFTLAALVAAAAAFVAGPAHASGSYLADPDSPACASDGDPGASATWHNAAPGDWHGASASWSSDPCWDYWMWTYGNGPTASGDTVTWSASVGAGVSCDITANIPSGNPGTSGYNFDSSAHYSIYSGGTRFLGDRHVNQQTAPTDFLGVSVDLGRWTAGSAGKLSVVLDDSSPYIRSGQTLYRVVAGSVGFSC